MAQQADPTVQDLIREEATRQGVPPELALSVAEQESGFNPTSIGPKLPSGESAVGTFQLLPSTATGLGVDPNHPLQNIQGGVKYLRQLLDKHQGNLEQTLAEYGGVKTDTSYVPGVLARMGKFTVAGAPTVGTGGPAPPPPSSSPLKPIASHNEVSPAPPPKPTFLADMLSGLDPRTSQGRRNLAGGIGAGVAVAAMPELSLPVMLARAASVAVPLAGAYVGGAAAEAGEQAVGAAGGAPPQPQAVQEAGRQQMGYEAAGQVVAWPLKAIGRRVLASTVSKNLSTGLSDALDAVKARLGMERTAVSPAQAGQLVEAVTHEGSRGIPGPAKQVKDQLGEAVGETAKSGPAVATAPIKTRLAELAEQITPMASHLQEPISVGGKVLPPEVAARVRERAVGGFETGLPPEHPLPRVLETVRDTIAEHDTIPFEEAHKLKRALDDAVTWDRGAKKQAEQITKGLRQTLRSEMAGHTPYDQATEAYSKVARLYSASGVEQLHKQILKDPESLVRQMNWQHPSQAQLVKDLTVDVSKGAGPYGAQQGEAAWNAVQAAWTHENLIAKGPATMASRMAQMEASNSGQQFIQTMYGDPAGQTVWQNLKDIGVQLEKVKADTAAFGESKLSRAAGPSSVARDLAYSALPGHPITKLGAMSRIVFGPDVKEMLQWASYATPRTQFLIQHVLTGPDPGMALTDFAKWWKVSGENPDRPMASHEPTPAATPPTGQGQTGPPPPRSLQP